MAGALAAALSRVARTPVTLTCAGRTDAGVHALDQVVHFDVPADRSAALEPGGPGQVVQQPGGPGHRGPGGRDRPRRGSTPATRPRPAATATWWSTPRCPTRCWPAWPGTWPTRSTCGPWPRPPTPCSASTTSGPSAGGCRAPRPTTPIPRRVLDARWTRLDGRPAGARTAGTSDLAAGDALDRPVAGPGGGRPAGLRDRGQRLLPPDGPLPGRDPGRRGPGPQAALGHPPHPAVGRPAARPASRPRPRA